MTDYVRPSPNRTIRAHQLGAAARHAGLFDWIAEPNIDYFAAEAGLTGTPLNAFAESSSSGSLTVEIDTGEGFVNGRWVARDETTDVTLPASDVVRVAIGAAYGQPDTIRIDTESAFGSNESPVPLFEYTTDSNGVIGSPEDLRVVGPLMQQDYDDPRRIELRDNVRLDYNGGRMEGINRLDFDDGTTRILWDRDTNGDALFFQRDISSAQTALALVGTSVGIGTIVDPQDTLHVGGHGRFDGNVTVNNVDGSGNVDAAGHIRLTGGSSARVEARNIRPHTGTSMYLQDSDGEEAIRVHPNFVHVGKQDGVGDTLVGDDEATLLGGDGVARVIVSSSQPSSSQAPYIWIKPD